MLTPFKVMLGIWPPGENWPLTFVGFKASFSSPFPRSVWPRDAMSGRTTPELSQRSFHWPSYIQPFFSSAQVPTPLPGLPPLPALGGPLHAFQPWQEPTHIEALLRFSSASANCAPSPICCISLSSSLAASARDCEAAALSPSCICLEALFR